MKRNKWMKYTYILLAMAVLMMGLLGCKEDATVGAESEAVSEEAVVSENVSGSESDETETDVEEDIVDTEESEEISSGDAEEYPISEEEIRDLVDANYNCVTNIFEVRLDGDWDAAEGDRVPVTDDAFESYAELEAYIRDVYVKEEADYLLYRYSCGRPLYWETDGVFYMRDELCGGGPCFGCAWESYTIEEYTIEGNQCIFSVLVKYTRESAPENITEETYYFTATYEDGWKLNSMVCKAGEGTSGHEEDELFVDAWYEIGEIAALDIVYDFYYGDSGLQEYRVYCEELPFLEAENLTFTENMLGWSYVETSKQGYVVYQYADEMGTEQEKYDPANPSPDKSKWILCSLGSTVNRDYYVFWLYQYVSHGDGTYHLTTGDFCIVSYDGNIVVSERKDSMGNDIDDPADWNDLYAYLNVSTPTLKAPVMTEEQAIELVDVNYFCLTELFVYGQLEGKYLSWKEGAVARVCDERFPTYDDLKTFLYKYYRSYVVADLLNHTYLNGPMYYEENDIFYMRLTDTTPIYVWEEREIPSFWTGYTITEIKQSGTGCEIRVVPECEEELDVITTYILRTTYVNGEWKLEDMGWFLWLEELTIEEEEYTFRIREVYNKEIHPEKWQFADWWVVEVYKDGELLQIIEQTNELSEIGIENKIWYEDANFDGKKDILLFYFYTGAQSAFIYQCYLATEEGFELCDSFHMFNPRIDAENRQIVGFSRGGGGYYEFTYYQYDGSEFVMTKREEYEWDYELEEYILTTYNF